ncbi:MAG: electron transfer flavoprotein subunit alpha [Ectothiorhodospiraceae bacterium]|nr:electron transfer flavoprotein subunit alpha [Ectothiorhodospiraceae bacterium]
MNILVFIERRDGAIKKPSLEAAKAASNIAGSTVTAVALGSDASDLDKLGGYGISKTLHVNDAQLDAYSTTAYAKAIAEAANASGSDTVFIAATAMGKDLAPRLAVKLDGAVAPDVTAITEEGGDLIATRPIYAGKAIETVKVTAAKKVFSLRPNVFNIGEVSEADSPVETLSVSFSDADFAVKATGTSISTDKLDVAEATAIVSGGRGMQGPENWNLIEDLAGVLDAATGASRAVVDADWRPHAEQVGQTGKTVSPTLYIACGISGAVQHLAGMSSSKCIVAINKDKDAPIFQVADYGIVGDVFEILPALTQELKQFLGK